MAGRSAPVTGRSSIGQRRGCNGIGRGGTFSRCCARGRAHSAKHGLRSLTFASGLDNPAGIAFDACGNLYVANSPSGGVGTTRTKVTPDGTASVFVTGLEEPLFVVAVPEPQMLGLFSLAAGCWWGQRRLIRARRPASE